MKFKVMAGNMFCGWLITCKDHLDTFINRDKKEFIGARITRYRKLKLIRVK